METKVSTAVDEQLWSVLLHIDTFISDMDIPINWGYPAKRALSAMRKHGG